MNEKKSILFIVNPKSGINNKKSILRTLQKRIDKEKYVFSVSTTQYAGHARKIAAEAVEAGINIVVAVGGDGTINEVASSLIHTNTALGIIPCGSGNGLSRHLHIPMEIRKAIDLINIGEVRNIDYGIINHIPFFCTCGIGFDAFISFKFASSKRRGFITYMNKALLDILKYKPDVYELEDEEGKTKYKAFLIACANASQYGNNAYIAPRASLCDGLLNVTILEPFSALEIPTLSYQLFNKTIEQNSRIKTLKCKKIHISRHEHGVVHYDGDPVMMDKELYIEIIEKGLHVIAPEESLDKKGLASFQQTVINYFNELRPYSINDFPFPRRWFHKIKIWIKNRFT